MYSRHAIVKFVSKNKNSKVTRGKGKSRYLVLHRFCLGSSQVLPCVFDDIIPRTYDVIFVLFPDRI